MILQRRKQGGIPAASAPGVITSSLIKKQPQSIDLEFWTPRRARRHSPQPRRTLVSLPDQYDAKQLSDLALLSNNSGIGCIEMDQTMGLKENDVVQKRSVQDLVHRIRVCLRCRLLYYTQS
jgi:hypothetical protein